MTKTADHGLWMPAGACDCHTHIFGPVTRFPYWAGRGYTPPDASIDEMSALHARLGIERVVIVHPSPYGTDNAVSLDAALKIGARARVVAVIDPVSATDAELEAMARGSVVGVRLNFASNGVDDVGQARAALRATAARIAGLGWHIQVFTTLDMIAALVDEMAVVGVPVVVDHFGLARAADGVDQKGFSALCDLLRAGHAWVKMSAGYRISDAPEWNDADDIAGALIAANQDHLVWGSDWPHPGHRPPGTAPGAFVAAQSVDDAMALRALWRWCGADRALFQRVLSENPSRLYKFE